MVMPQKISWKDSIFFFDIDDTLISTLATTFIASAGIEQVFSKAFDMKTGKNVRNNFDKIFRTLAVGHFQNKKLSKEEQIFHEEVLRIITESQQQVVKQYGHAKKWSREVFIWYAAQLSGLTVAPELVKIAADAYWMMLSEKIALLPGVKQLFTEIHAHARPIYLMSGSDARLTMKTIGQFVYDPIYSEAMKRERIELLRKKGIQFYGVSIGDPEDKPHKDFFQKGIMLARKELGYHLDLSNAIMAGDSYTADLEVPKNMFGFGLVVLLKKDNPQIEYIDKHYIKTGVITDILKFLQ